MKEEGSIGGEKVIYTNHTGIPALYIAGVCAIGCVGV